MQIEFVKSINSFCAAISLRPLNHLEEISVPDQEPRPDGIQGSQMILTGVTKEKVTEKGFFSSFFS